MKTRILTILVVLLACAGSYCGWRYYTDVIRPERQIAAADDEQTEMFSQIKPRIIVPVTTAAAVSQDIPAETQVTEAAAEHILEEAERINDSVVGWITIPDTHIDYPVCQGEDNDFYLHNGFDGRYNYELGCPFLDFRCDSDFSGFNSIVYAHHMTKQRMFADISLFKDESFFQSHSTGQLVIGNEVHTVQFFAYLNVYPTASAYKTEFADDQEKREYMEYIEETADYCIYTADELAESGAGLHLLLLSTCTYEFDDARGILVGVIEQINN